MKYEQSNTPRNWSDHSASVGPALLGAAAGLLISDLMHGNARRASGIFLAALGVAAISPKVGDKIKDKVAGPETQRGSQKTLEGIRNVGAGTPDMYDFEDDEENQLGVG